jgi:hypothetical protein
MTMHYCSGLDGAMTMILQPAKKGTARRAPTMDRSPGSLSNQAIENSFSEGIA